METKCFQTLTVTATAVLQLKICTGGSDKSTQKSSKILSTGTFSALHCYAVLHSCLW